MRVAYVGLSGPLYYDYKTPAEPGPADMVSSPNPILDSPFGLLLLFDEIWFLTRSLCPSNMRELEYVRFLDEDQALPDMKDLDVSEVRAAAQADASWGNRYENVRGFFSRYQHILKRMGVDWDAAADNHTHTLHIGGQELRGNSLDLDCVLTDLEIVGRLGGQAEMVANSFAQRWLDFEQPSLSEADLAHVLVIDRIPNYLSQEGPYHPVLEEARANPYLRDFREWVSTRSGSRDLHEAASVKQEVEAAIRDTERRLFLRYLDENRRYRSVGKTLAGALADVLVPFSGTMSEVLLDLREARHARELGWQGFLVGLEDSAGGS
jgi:hypothetical protein